MQSQIRICRGSRIGGANVEEGSAHISSGVRSSAAISQILDGRCAPSGLIKCTRFNSGSLGSGGPRIKHLEPFPIERLSLDPDRAPTFLQPSLFLARESAPPTYANSLFFSRALLDRTKLCRVVLLSVSMQWIQYAHDPSQGGINQDRRQRSY